MLELLLKKGAVSTFDLGNIGYDQPPRAAQDLKEAGVKLTTTFGKHPKTGSRMAIYSLAKDQPLLTGTFSGRKAFPKKFRHDCLEHYHLTCCICNVVYEPAVLQIDHRIPYIIGGDPDNYKLDNFMLLCGSHQRLKSWECEHCPNRKIESTEICRVCYWAMPDGDYEHIATILEKRIDVTWRGEYELGHYQRLVSFAKKKGLSLSDTIKELVKQIK